MERVSGNGNCCYYFLLTREEFSDDAEEGAAALVGALDFEDFELFYELELLGLGERR